MSLVQNYCDKKGIDLNQIFEMIDKANPTLKKAIEEAECDLIDYLDRMEIENEEYDVESPLYFEELRDCKTVEEVQEFMTEFGWPTKQQTEKQRVVIELSEELSEEESEEDLTLEDDAIANSININYDHLCYVARHQLAECYTGTDWLKVMNQLDNCQGCQGVAFYMLMSGVKKGFWDIVLDRVMNME